MISLYFELSTSTSALQCRLVVIETTQTNLDELVVVFLLGESWRKFHTNIVLGETMHRLASWRLLKEHLSLGTDVLGIELLGLLVAQLQQNAWSAASSPSHLPRMESSRLRFQDARSMGTRGAA